MLGSGLEKGKWRMKIVYFFMLPLILLSACGQETPAPPAAVRPVSMFVIGDTAAAQTHLYSGEVRARHETVLSFRTGGKIMARQVEVGERVAAGRVLARLDPTDNRLQEEASRAQYRLAKDEMERYRELRDKGFVSQSALDAKEAAFKAAAAQAGMAVNQLAYTELRTDHTGVITAILAEVGQVVSAGQPVFHLAQTGEREVVIAIPESRLDAVKVGAPAVIEIGAAGDGSHTLNGDVREIAPVADAASRTYAARVAFKSTDASVALGMTARVWLEEAGRAQHARAYRVPLTAIFQQGEQAAVWVIEADNTISLRPVRIGAYRDEGALIVEGVEAGQRIVSAGVHKLTAGERIQPGAGGNPQ